MEIKKKFHRLFEDWRLKTKKRRLATPRAKIIFAILLLIAIFLVYLIISLLCVSRGEVALVKLEKSFLNEAICHEECFLRRQKEIEIIKAELEKGSARLEKRIVAYCFKTETVFEFKKELIRILAAVYGKNNLPAYLNDYLIDPRADVRLIREIWAVFAPRTVNSSDLLANLHRRIITAADEAEKIEAVKTLAKVGGGSEIDNYFLLLNSEAGVAVKKQAISGISNVLEKSKYFTLDQLVLLKSFILAPETDKRLRQEMVLLVGDYYLLYPQESEAVWQAVYDNNSLDIISRFFSADSLNHLADKKLELPAVSSTDWADYYNQ